MADINQSASFGLSKKRRTLKSLPKVDLTAMVDLAFLLITFFMLTTSLSKQYVMKVYMPVDSDDSIEIADDRTVTVCLGDNNKALMYMGTINNPRDLQIINPANTKLVLQKQMSAVFKTTGKNLMILIKPSNKSSFKDLVDVLDEISIINAHSYAIVDITSEERIMLAENAIY